MLEKNNEMSVFARRVLARVGENKLTAEEIWENYKRYYPQGFIERTLHLHEVGLTKIVNTLFWLAQEGFIHKESTNFTDEALEKETEIFWISNKGRKFLLPKK